MIIFVRGGAEICHCAELAGMPGISVSYENIRSCQTSAADSRTVIDQLGADNSRTARRVVHKPRSSLEKIVTARVRHKQSRSQLTLVGGRAPSDAQALRQFICGT